MEALRVKTTIEKDGEISLTGLPYTKGDEVEMILLVQPTRRIKRRPLTARALRRAGVVGLWKNRTDLPDSAAYARQLREQAQRRRK